MGGRVGSGLGLAGASHPGLSICLIYSNNLSLSIADITLGLYVHRLWQLGMEEEYFEEGVRPHLSVFYKAIRERPSFLKVTRWALPMITFLICATSASGGKEKLATEPSKVKQMLWQTMPRWELVLQQFWVASSW